MPRKSFWARLPFGVRMATAGLGVLALVAGTTGGIAAMTSDDKTRVVNAAGGESTVVEVPPAEIAPQPPASETGLGADAGGHAEAEQEAADNRTAPGVADRTATRTPRRTTPVDGTDKVTGPGAASGADGPAAPAAPAIHTERVSETEAIPFRTRLIRDPSLPRGSREIQTPGIPGERVLVYEVTYTGTRETSRRLIDSTVTRQPQHRVVAFGNRGGSGQHSGGRGHRRECRLGLGSCVHLGRNAVCIDGKTDPREESIIDGDLSLLNPADIDELELTLPCEDDKEDDSAKAGRKE